MRNTTVKSIIELKRQRKIACLTAYSFFESKLLSEAGIDILLVGDSLGMVFQGHGSTISVTLKDMVYHTQVVTRGNTGGSLVVADMPFLSAERTVTKTLSAAGKLIQKGGASAVKLEGGLQCVPHIQALVAAGIPVMGHIGLNPQKILKLGQYEVTGKTTLEERQILEDAKALQDAGVFAIVLECMKSGLAKKITEALAIPTIGIGAGPHCDGHIMVNTDFFGIFNGFKARYVRSYLNLGSMIPDAVKRYIDDIECGDYPSDKESYS